MGDIKSSNSKKKTVTTSKDHPTTTVPYTQHSVVVGFEVNQPKAFKCVKIKNEIPSYDGFGSASRFMSDDCTHDLNIDTGHAFFYLVKNDKVTKFFSFGPADPEGAKLLARNPGSPDFGIGEETKLFRIPLSEKQYDALMKDTEAVRQKISSKDIFYTPLINDTCAEEARDILKAHIPNLPEGSSKIEYADTKVAIAVNPYMWHKNFKEATLIMNGKKVPKYTELTHKADGELWGDIIKGDSTEDPLVGR
jgi:hypothetical protein